MTRTWAFGEIPSIGPKDDGPFCHACPEASHGQLIHSRVDTRHHEPRFMAPVLVGTAAGSYAASQTNGLHSYGCAEGATSGEACGHVSWIGAGGMCGARQCGSQEYRRDIFARACPVAGEGRHLCCLEWLPGAQVPGMMIW